MGQSLSDSGSYLRDRRPRSPDGAEPARVAHAAALGLPRFRPLPARRSGAEPGRGGRAARRPGQGVGASVLRALVAGAGPGRGVPEVAGRTRRGGCAGGRARGRAGVAPRARERMRAPETLVRRRREWAAARDEQQFRAAQRSPSCPGGREACPGPDPARRVAREDGQDHRCDRILPGDRSRGFRHRRGQAGRRESLCGRLRARKGSR